MALGPGVGDVDVIVRGDVDAPNEIAGKSDITPRSSIACAPTIERKLRNRIKEGKHINFDMLLLANLVAFSMVTHCIHYSFLS